MISRFILIIIVVILSGLPSHADTFDTSRTWHNLLYYERSGDGYISLAHGDNFFISEEGPVNPKAEYQASVERVIHQDPEFRKKFPLRYKILANHLGVPYQPLVKPDPRIQGVTLAYPNRYMANPASMLGHVFIVFNSMYGRMDSDLFHHIADPSHPNGSYILNGLTGKFKSQYYSEPFYKRIKTYTYTEDRDIIYFDLNVSADQIENLLLHKKEVESSFYYYYFLSKNCVFFIGKFLNVVLDDDVIEKAHLVYPAQLINRLSQKGLLQNQYHRESSTKQFRKQYATLTGFEKKAVQQLLTEPVLTVPTNPNVLRPFLSISEYMINNNSQRISAIRHNRILAYQHLKKVGNATVRPLDRYAPHVTGILSKQWRMDSISPNQWGIAYHPIYYDNDFNDIEIKRLNALAPRLSITTTNSVQMGLTIVDIATITRQNAILKPRSWLLGSYIGYTNGVTTDQWYAQGSTYSLGKTSVIGFFLGANWANYSRLRESPLTHLGLYPYANLHFINNGIHPHLKFTIDVGYQYASGYILPRIEWPWGPLYYGVDYMHDLSGTDHRIRASARLLLY
jgi:hypothetical protein